MLWKWMKAISSQNIANLGRFQGVCSVIADSAFSSAGTCGARPFLTRPMHHEADGEAGGKTEQIVEYEGFPPVFQSLARRFALQICGWPVEGVYLEPFLTAYDSRAEP